MGAGTGIAQAPGPPGKWQSGKAPLCGTPDLQGMRKSIREQDAEERKQLAQMQKMWALRELILDAHILSLREKVQKPEQEIDEIVMEKLTLNFKCEKGW